MPDNSSYASTLRADGHSVQIYLSTLLGNQVLAATVSAFTSTSLTISITSGSVSNVKRGFRVVVKTATGFLKGTVAVRAGGTLDSTHLPIRETSRGDISFAAGDVVTVFDDVYWLVDRIPEADEAFKPDGLDVGTLNTSPPPVPVTGGVFVGELNADGYCDAPMDSTDSYGFTATAPNSLTRLWAASGATFQIGTSSSIAPTLRYTAAGKYRVDLTLTDPANSASRTAYPRVRIHDENDPPFEVESIGQVTADELTGWRLSVTLRDAASLDDIPDLCPVVVWIKTQAFGADVPSRSNLLMVGVVRREQNAMRLGSPRLTLEIVSPLAALAELPGFSKVMTQNGSPDDWSEIADLTVQRSITQILAFYTWLIEAGYDIVFEGFSDADYSQLFVEANNPLEQLRELARGRAARIVCKRTARFEIQSELAATEPAARDAMTATYTVTPDDVWIGERGDQAIPFEREHKLPLMTYHARGFTPGQATTANTPIFARVPASPAPGNQIQTREKFIGSLAEVYRWCELFAADYNGVYQPASSDARLMSPTLHLTFQGAYWALFDYHREWIRLDGFGTDTNLRGIDLDAFRWRFVSATMEYAGGTMRTTINLRAETALPVGSAVDDTPDSGEYIGAPPVVPPEYIPLPPGLPPLVPPPTPPPGAPVPIQRGTLKLGIVTDEGKLVMTQEGDTTSANGGPYWESTTLTGVGATLCAEQLVGSFDTLIVATETHVYKIESVGAGVPTVDEVHEFTNTASGCRRTIGVCEADPDWVLITSYHPDFGVSATYSTDAGETWDEVIVSSYLPFLVGACDEITQDWDAATGDATWTTATSALPLSYHGDVGNNVGGTVSTGGRTTPYVFRAAFLSGWNISAPVCVLNTPCTVTSVSFWVKPNGTGYCDYVDCVRIHVNFHDEDQVLIGGETLYLGVTSAASACPAFTWTNWTWNGVAPNCKYITISFAGAGATNHTYLIDDIIINDGGSPSVEQHTPVVTLNPRVPGTAFTVAFDAAGDPQAWLTVDYGATWTEQSSPNLNCGTRLGSHLIRPYTDVSKFYLTYAFGTSPYSFQLMRVTGAQQTVAITPQISGTYYAMAGVGAKEIAIARTDKNKIVVIGRSGGAASTGAVFTTLDGGTTWATRLAVSSANAAWRIVEIGTDGSSVYLLSADQFIYSSNFLASQDDRSGNLAALAAGEPLKLFRWG